MGNFISGIISFFSNGIGQAVGKTVEKGVVIAAITPLLLWYYKGGKDEIAVCFTYAQLIVPGLILLIVGKIIFYTRPGSVRDRTDYR